MITNLKDWEKTVEALQAVNSPAYPSPPDERDHRLFRYMRLQPETPEVFDMFHSFIPQAPDQLKRGVCVSKTNKNAYNTAYNVMGRLPKGGFSTGLNYVLSKQFDGIPESEGTFPRVSLDISRKYGNCTELSLPYSRFNQFNPLQLPAVTEEHLKEAANYKLEGYVRLNGVLEMQQALSAGQLIMTAHIVTDNFGKFPSYLKPDKGVIPIPNGHILGGHATLFYGYSKPRSWKDMLNSWGPDWALNGSAYMPYGDFIEYKTEEGVDFFWEAWAMIFNLKDPTVGREVKMWVDKSIALVDGVPTSIDLYNREVVPFISQERAFIPSRFLSEAFAFKVDWDKYKKQATIDDLKGKVIILWENKPTALVNGVPKQIDKDNKLVVPTLRHNRISLPVRFINEEVGLKVDYNSHRKEIKVTRV